MQLCCILFAIATGLTEDAGNGILPLIKLTPNNRQQNVIVGDNITITCATASSAFMAWSSDEYIGRSVQLEYFFVNETGSILRSPKEPATFANLTMVNSSVFMLESQLHIMVSVDYPQFNVTCHNPGNNLTKSITFFIGKPCCRSSYIP